MGGLGNMLFQIATGETWRSKGMDVVYTDMDDNLAYIASHFSVTRHSDVYKSLFPNFNWDEHKEPRLYPISRHNVPFVYTDIALENGVEYVGYFQSEKNFPDKDLVRWLFEPSEGVKEILSFPFGGEITCSIHVRRQDYLKLSAHHANLDMDYYNKAMWTLEPFNVDRFLIFSDDIEWCKTVFKGDQFVFMDTPEFIALFQMGLCNHNIIANSSLSWWGAWLREDLDKVIIAPEKWFGINGPDPKDIIPFRWIRL